MHNVLESTAENQQLRHRIVELEKAKAISDKLYTEASIHMQNALYENRTLREHLKDTSKALRETQALLMQVQEQL